ncbi:TetR/AcrR family transcriptional regulator [Rhodovulum sulfidophilum]|uniref:TetR/AcrR family transcriptional regulator n=1 Tax=Rhodovulum sulfidophilum TaxID=35806 RepID=UPI0019249813|nr:TetR/AcrR family transcriptional regulator [Rhodovulum sulfidophilum]MBL3574840.1 TetR/AcrR family transcriptional regulator [Rhodovulum sulfidophilum]MCE8433023.1 TetR/AcrR family transcriptional regulator [Rhodovulum sulfidophilum]MCF4118300.1 TetR/AcrR family transcriptional regulator [Rhodovulum sulfidophilum]
MTATTDRIHKKRKFDQGLEGAREAFLRDGFKPASVAPILHRAGVSKASLYTGFPDKRLLFSEVMQRECDRLTGAARHEIDLSTPAETVLKTAPRHISSVLLSGFYQAVFRICAANAASRVSARPSTAPRRCDCATTRHGDLVIGHEASAADRVVALCKVDPYTRRVFRRGSDGNEVEIVG